MSTSTDGTETKKKIPVTILTGFLGAGKTTFNHMMKSNHGKKIAIIENEFGEVGVDDGLIKEESKEQIIEMLNGCICCTVREDLVTVLQKLLKERAGQFDYVVIETTGLADPAPVAQTFFVHDELKDDFYLDSIVTFVDCKNTGVHLREDKEDGAENEAVEQVAFADVLVLNKIDLVNAEELKALKAELRAINATAKMIESTHSKIEMEDVLEIRAFDLDKTVAMDDEFLKMDAEHKHDKSISSVGFVVEGSFMPDKFNAWLQKFLSEKAVDVFRSKGIFSIVGSDERHVFQAVHMIMSFGSSEQVGSKLEDWGKDEKRINKLCFIGRNLDKDFLHKELLKCLSDGKPVDPGTPPKKKLRFNIGDVVECQTGEWLKGKIAKFWYREPYWATGRFAPYQVLLDSGSLIYVPKDSNALIRKPGDL